MENGYLNCGTPPASVIGGMIALGLWRSSAALLGPGSEAAASRAASLSLKRSIFPNIVFQIPFPHASWQRFGGHEIRIWFSSRTLRGFQRHFLRTGDRGTL